MNGIKEKVQTAESGLNVSTAEIDEYKKRIETTDARYSTVPGFASSIVCLESIALHGIILNGPLLWANMERRTSPEDIWKNKMLQHFTPEEINEAKELLWEVCGEDKLGKKTRRIGDAKSKSEVEDICKGLVALSEQKVMPVFLATDNMMNRVPVVKDSQIKPNYFTIENKIKDMEQLIKTSSESQADHITRNHQRIMSKIDIEDKKIDNLKMEISNIDNGLKQNFNLTTEKKKVTFEDGFIASQQNQRKIFSTQQQPSGGRLQSTK